MRVRGRSGDTGASAVEFAIGAPILLLLIFFSIQTALWWYGRTVALQAAREGVSHLRLAQNLTAYDLIEPVVRKRTADYATSVGGPALVNPQVTDRYDDAQAQARGQAKAQVTVTVTGDVITLWPGPRLSVTQEASGRIERFEADEGDHP